MPMRYCVVLFAASPSSCDTRSSMREHIVDLHSEILTSFVEMCDALSALAS